MIPRQVSGGPLKPFFGLSGNAQWRVAQPFDFASTGNSVGAPFFAFFAKGGNHERLHDPAYLRTDEGYYWQHLCPPLQRTKGCGTLS